MVNSSVSISDTSSASLYHSEVHRTHSFAVCELGSMILQQFCDWTFLNWLMFDIFCKCLPAWATNYLNGSSLNDAPAALP